MLKYQQYQKFTSMIQQIELQKCYCAAFVFATQHTWIHFFDKVMQTYSVFKNCLTCFLKDYDWTWISLCVSLTPVIDRHTQKHTPQQLLLVSLQSLSVSVSTEGDVPVWDAAESQFSSAVGSQAGLSCRNSFRVMERNNLYNE